MGRVPFAPYREQDPSSHWAEVGPWSLLRGGTPWRLFRGGKKQGPGFFLQGKGSWLLPGRTGEQISRAPKEGRPARDGCEAQGSPGRGWAMASFGLSSMSPRRGSKPQWLQGKARGRDCHSHQAELGCGDMGSPGKGRAMADTGLSQGWGSDPPDGGPHCGVKALVVTRPS